MGYFIEIVRDVLATAAFGTAMVFGAAGGLGLFRFPDAWSRLQASSLAGTTSVFSLMLGALLSSPSWEMGARILIIMAFFLVSSPTGGHIVARYLWNSGQQPWKPRQEKT